MSKRKKIIKKVKNTQTATTTTSGINQYDPSLNSEQIIRNIANFEENIIYTKIFNEDEYLSKIKPALESLKTRLIVSNDLEKIELATNFFNHLHEDFSKLENKKNIYFTSFSDVIKDIILRFEKDIGFDLHKGAFYYWVSYSLFNQNYIDRAFFYLFSALEEDKKIQSYHIFKNQPAYKIISLNSNNVGTFSLVITEINNFWYSQLSKYNHNISKSLNNEDFINYFIKYELYYDISLYFGYLTYLSLELNLYFRFNPSNSLFFSSKCFDLLFQFSRLIENILNKLIKNKIEVNLPNGIHTKLKIFRKEVYDKTTDQYLKDIIDKFNIMENRYASLFKFEEENFYTDITINNSKIRFKNIITFNLPELNIDTDFTNYSDDIKKIIYILIAISRFRNFSAHIVNYIYIHEIFQEFLQFLYYELFLIIEWSIQIV